MQDGCGTAAEGSPSGTRFLPFEVDCTLQNSDTWFFQEGIGYKTIEELVSVCVLACLRRMILPPAQ